MIYCDKELYFILVSANALKSRPKRIANRVRSEFLALTRMFSTSHPSTVTVGIYPFSRLEMGNTN